jgi:DNA-directed RNA polymerase subunit RPC12/RpoP
MATVVSKLEDHHVAFTCLKCKAHFGIGDRNTMVTFCPQCGVRFDVFGIRHYKERKYYYDNTKIVKIRALIIVNMPCWYDESKMEDKIVERIVVSDRRSREWFLFKLKMVRGERENYHPEPEKVTIKYKFEVVTNT